RVDVVRSGGPTDEARCVRSRRGRERVEERVVVRVGDAAHSRDEGVRELVSRVAERSKHVVSYRLEHRTGADSEDCAAELTDVTAAMEGVVVNIEAAFFGIDHDAAVERRVGHRRVNEQVMMDLGIVDGASPPVMPTVDDEVIAKFAAERLDGPG